MKVHSQHPWAQGGDQNAAHRHIGPARSSGRSPQARAARALPPLRALHSSLALLLNLSSEARDRGAGQITQRRPQPGCTLMPRIYLCKGLDRGTSLATITFHTTQGGVQGAATARFAGFLGIYLLREGVNLKSNFPKRLYQVSRRKMHDFAQGELHPAAPATQKEQSFQSCPASRVQGALSSGAPRSLLLQLLKAMGSNSQF